MSFQDAQFQFAAHLRDPDNQPIPPDVEDRRMKIYRELIYNNISNFIKTGFPVLYSLYSDANWHAMVRDFVCRHTSHSPYFLEISQEFLRYLQEERGDVASDPPFLLELAHYEWVELALSVSTEQLPELNDKGLPEYPRVSPLAWSLSYQYPVHRISPDYQPQQPPEQPTFLIVYRNRSDQVKFIEANGVTVRLLQLFSENDALSADQALQQIAAELQHPEPEKVVANGYHLIRELIRQDVLYSPNPSN